MAQKRAFEFKADDSTFDFNQRVLDLLKPGLYHGFDAVLAAGLNLSLTMVNSGNTFIDENEVESDPKGMYITKQGVIVREDAAITLPVSVGDPINPRIDLVVAEHLYTAVEGGQPAIYLIIKGTPSATPVAPALTNSKRQTILGQLYVPANMASLNEAGVEYTKSIQPDYAGNGYRARLEALEQFKSDATTELGTKMAKAANLSDVASKSAARNNLELGNHVTNNYSGSGGNHGTANSVARGNHLHGGVYEPVFNKNTAFNKNFGTGAGTVCQGNDSRLSDSRKCNNTFDNAATSRNNLGLGNHVTHNYGGSGSASSVARSDHNHSGTYEPMFSKKSAFNKNFGTTSGTVCQGNDSRLSNSRKCNNTFDNAATSRNNLNVYSKSQADSEINVVTTAQKADLGYEAKNQGPSSAIMSMYIWKRNGVVYVHGVVNPQSTSYDNGVEMYLYRFANNTRYRPVNNSWRFPMAGVSGSTQQVGYGKVVYESGITKMKFYVHNSSVYAFFSFSYPATE